MSPLYVLGDKPVSRCPICKQAVFAATGVTRVQGHSFHPECIATRRVEPAGRRAPEASASPAAGSGRR